MDLVPLEGTSFAFVDCYSASAAEHVEPPPSKKVYAVSSFSNLEGIGMAISKAAHDLKPPVRIVFYTVSTLFLHNSPAAIAKFIQIITSRVKTNIGFIAYAMHEGVHDGNTTTLLRSPQLARRELASFGSFPEQRLVFVDATSTQLLLPSTEKYKITNIDDLDHIVRVIKDALRKSRPARVVIDSMEFLADRFDRKLVMRYWREAIATADRGGGAGCSMFFISAEGGGGGQGGPAMWDFVVGVHVTRRGGGL